MPTIKCRRCGGLTNTVFADHIDSPDDKADRCFLRWENDKWVKGCGYDDADTFCLATRRYTDGVLASAKEGEETEFNTCGTCGATGGRAGNLIGEFGETGDCECCRLTRETGKITLVAGLPRTQDEIDRMVKIITGDES